MTEWPTLKVQTPEERLNPRPTITRLGGVMVPVAELRARDLIDLKTILDGPEPTDLDHLVRLAFDGDPGRELLARSWAMACSWQPLHGWPPGTFDWLIDPRARSLVAATALGTLDPSMTLDRAADLVRRSTPGEWARLVRIAFGFTAAEMADAQADPLDPETDPIDWAEVVANADRIGMTRIDAAQCPLYRLRYHLAGNRHPAEGPAADAARRRVESAIGRGEPGNVRYREFGMALLAEEFWSQLR